ncbi:MAG: hypothetical protein ACKOZY_11165 [Flavobacteriales bacterium]
MKNITYFALAVGLMSCATQRMATTGTVEHDEVYYRPGDTYITELNLTSNVTPGTSGEDEYITQEAIDQQQNEQVFSNSNGWGSSWLNQSAMGFGLGSGMFGGYSPFGYGGYPSGWNNYGYGGYQPYYGMGYGYSPYYGGGWNNGWGYGSGWNGGYGGYGYYPSFGYGYGYNPYYGGYSNYWGGGSGSPSTSDWPTGTIFGPRNPIGTISVNNSSYSSDVFYSGDKRDAQEFAPVLIQDESSNASTETDHPMARPELKPQTMETSNNAPAREYPQDGGHSGNTEPNRNINGTHIENRGNDGGVSVQPERQQTVNPKPERGHQDAGRTVTPSRQDPAPSRSNPTPSRDVAPSRGGGSPGGGGGGGRKK